MGNINKAIDLFGKNNIKKMVLSNNNVSIFDKKRIAEKLDKNLKMSDKQLSILESCIPRTTVGNLFESAGQLRQWAKDNFGVELTIPMSSSDVENINTTMSQFSDFMSEDAIMDVIAPCNSVKQMAAYQKFILDNIGCCDIGDKSISFDCHRGSYVIDFATSIPVIYDLKSMAWCDCSIKLLTSLFDNRDRDQKLGYILDNLHGCTDWILDCIHQCIVGIPPSNNNKDRVIDEIVNYVNQYDLPDGDIDFMVSAMNFDNNNQPYISQPTIKQVGPITVVTVSKGKNNYSIKLSDCMAGGGVNICIGNDQYLYDGDDVTQDGIIVGEDDDNWSIIHESLKTTNKWKQPA